VLLSHDQILAAQDIETEDVKVPEWADPATGADEVRVKGLTGEERDSFEAACMMERPAYDAKGKPIRGRTEMARNLANTRAKLVARSVVDEQGERLFTDHDVAVLGKKSAAALDRVFEVAGRLSGLSDEDIEELSGKSEAAQSGASTSSLPESSDSPAGEPS
jgi:hypothetical protein